MHRRIARPVVARPPEAPRSLAPPVIHCVPRIAFWSAGRCLPNLGRFRSKLTKFEPPTWGRNRPNLGQMCFELGQHRPEPTNCVPSSTEFGPVSTDFDQAWPHVVQICLTSANFDLNWTAIKHTGPEVDQRLPDFGRLGPNPTRFGQQWSGINPRTTSTDLTRFRPNLGHHGRRNEG